MGAFFLLQLEFVPGLEKRRVPIRGSNNPLNPFLVIGIPVEKTTESAQMQLIRAGKKSRLTGYSEQLIRFF
jgi:hypothetical protein